MFRNSIFFGTVALALLVLALFTIRMWVATTDVVSSPERARAADTARWQAMADSYAGAQHGWDAAVARWTGLAESYGNVIPVTGAGYDRLRAIEADAARWQAQADAYRGQRGWDASAARWTGLAQYYQNKISK